MKIDISGAEGMTTTDLGEFQKFVTELPESVKTMLLCIAQDAENSMDLLRGVGDMNGRIRKCKYNYQARIYILY